MLGNFALWRRPAARHLAGAAVPALHLAVALLAAAGALVLAAHHPLWPVAVAAATGAWIVAAFAVPGLWVFVVPAVLPLANLAPWTGWIAFEEFDLVVLGALAAGHARLALARSFRFSPGRVPGALVLAVALLGAVSAARGWAAAGGLGAAGWFDGYTGPLNSVRVFKPLLYAVLAWPLVQRQMRASAWRTPRHFVAGMLVGLGLAALAAAWERAAYPGLLDFGEPYRITALFWEMHVGGAALDAYLAIGVPFVALALWTIHSRATWGAAAAFALLVGHACLTTFSRGVYLAAALGLGTLLFWRAPDDAAAWLRRHAPSIIAAGALALAVVAALFGWLQYAGAAAGLLATGAVLLVLVRSGRLAWRTGAAFGLVMAIAVEAMAVLGSPDSFMRERLSHSPLDTRGRLAHWAHGLSLPQGADWLWGIGLGRQPAAYAAAPGGGEFSGQVAFVQAGGGDGAARVSGPSTRAQLGGLLGLTQRVPLRPRYQLRLDARAATPAELRVDVCERHLLYDGECHSTFVRIQPVSGPANEEGMGAWQPLHLAPRGPAWQPPPWPLRRSMVLSLSVATPGASVDLDNVTLTGPDGADVTFNGSFSQGLAGWLPSARRYFRPWHIDSLALEILIERGLPALLLMGAILVGAWRRLRHADLAFPQGRFMAAALVGACGLGLVSSVLDVPRVTFLVYLLLAVAFERSRWGPRWREA